MDHYSVYITNSGLDGLCYARVMSISKVIIRVLLGKM